MIRNTALKVCFYTANNLWKYNARLGNGENVRDKQLTSPKNVSNGIPKVSSIDLSNEEN